MAAEFQRTDLGAWLCDDDFPDDESRQVYFNLYFKLSTCVIKMKSELDTRKEKDMFIQQLVIMVQNDHSGPEFVFLTLLFLTEQQNIRS